MGKLSLWITCVALGVLSCAPTSTRHSFASTLTWGDFSFEITENGDELTIQPQGLTEDNRAVKHPLEGFTVQGAEIGDLNQDGFPEVLVYLLSGGSGHYGNVFGYSVNAGKSMSQIYFPRIAQNPEAQTGYLGHDEFTLKGNRLEHRFPIYKEGDSNSHPTGGVRHLSYRLKDGEGGRYFEVVKIASE